MFTSHQVEINSEVAQSPKGLRVEVKLLNAHIFLLWATRNVTDQGRSPLCVCGGRGEPLLQEADEKDSSQVSGVGCGALRIHTDWELLAFHRPLRSPKQLHPSDSHVLGSENGAFLALHLGGAATRRAELPLWDQCSVGWPPHS
jgi:hypothetical protein